MTQLRPHGHRNWIVVDAVPMTKRCHMCIVMSICS